MSEAHVTPVPREARAYQGRRAGLVTRLVAAVLDALVVATVLLGAYLAYAGVVFLLNPRNFDFPQASWVLGLTAPLVVATFYLAVGWTLSGRTYGAHVMGLRVVTRGGGRVRPIPALLRSAGCVLYPIGLLWCAVSRSNLSVQDILLRTCVVYDWEPRVPRTPGA